MAVAFGQRGPCTFVESLVCKLKVLVCRDAFEKLESPMIDGVGPVTVGAG
jgi:hypothetical protein